MNDLVSIVLPVYNGEKYLQESIDSILSQTYQNWELIIIDDCSTDSSPEIAKKYAEKDERVSCYRNKENLKLPNSLNKGFSLSKGNYLTWTSDDNRYLPDALTEMVKALKTNQADFVFASCLAINAAGKKTGGTHIVNQRVTKSIIGGNCVGACFMYTRTVYERVGDYDSTLLLVEDFDYWQRICSRFKAVTISNFLYEYRFHDGALTSTMKKEMFYRNMKQMLLKNRPLFGKLDWEQKKYYYSALNNCAVQLNEKKPYGIRVHFYDYIFLIYHALISQIDKSADN